MNRLAKEERSVVDSVAGTTVDPVDSIVTLGGEEWRFVDTAGLRRKGNTPSGMEDYARLRTEAALQAAEGAVVLLAADDVVRDRKSTRLKSSQAKNPYAVFCFKKK